MNEYTYIPRPQFLAYHERTQPNAVIIAHRRAGKTVALLNDMLIRALMPRPDNLRQQFVFLAPTQTQAREISWNYLKDFTSQFAQYKGYSRLEQYLSITLPDPTNTSNPGSTITLRGAENAERIRGQFLDGIVIDEAADISPYIVSQIIQPALADRRGWLTVSGTLKSHEDYLFKTYDKALLVPNLWFHMNLKASESGIIHPDKLAELRQEMSEEEYEVEFENNPDKNITGKILMPYLKTNQITNVPYDPQGQAPFTAWDLGISDSTALWVGQITGREIHILDYHQESGKGLDYFVEWLRKLPYSAKLHKHFLPHDSKVREIGNYGKSRLDSLRGMGMRNMVVVPRLSKDQQIELARTTLPRCWFNSQTTKEGIAALRNYSFTLDKIKKVFSRTPLHNQYSNGADAFLMLACAISGRSGDDVGAGWANDSELDSETPMQETYEIV